MKGCVGLGGLWRKQANERLGKNNLVGGVNYKRRPEIQSSYTALSSPRPSGLHREIPYRTDANGSSDVV